MSGSIGAAKVIGKLVLADLKAKIIRVHLRVIRQKHYVYSGILGCRQIRLQGAGVLGKIVGIVELGGVYVDGEHGPVVLPNTFLQQRQMAFMQGTHGWHKTHTAAHGGP